MQSRPGLILQHAATGPPGRLGAWASSRGIPFRVHRSWESLPDLDPADYAWVAPLGSAESVHQTDIPWVVSEVEFLRGAVTADVPVLGICWGAEALALVLDGEVGPAALPEKGWVAIVSDDPAIPAGPWLHYHSEGFTVPAGAIELARSPAGPSAFRIGPHLAVQFHPEADAAIAAGWAAKDPDQTAESRAAFAAQGERWDAEAGTLAERLFDEWWAWLNSAAAPAAGSGRRS